MNKRQTTAHVMFMSVLMVVVALTLGTKPCSAASVTIQIPVEAYDTANADSLFPDQPDWDPDRQLQEIWGHLELLSYLAFDLSQVPQGFDIVGATVSVFDSEPDINDVVEIALLDVPTDWDRTTFTYDSAMAQYSAIEAADEEGPIAAFDPAKLLWLGNALMDNQVEPGRATVNSRREMESVDPFVEADLAAALQDKLANGDGLVTLVIHGTTRNNNTILGIDYGDSEKGPTLELTLALSGGAGSTTTYNFDDGTFNDWTQVWTSTIAAGPTELGLISETDPTVGNSVPPLPLSAPAFIGPVPVSLISIA